MSRSFKKAFVTISHRMADNVHSAARQLVHAKLNRIDARNLDEEELSLLDADIQELGLEDLGTKFGLEFDDNPKWDNARNEMQRK